MKSQAFSKPAASIRMTVLRTTTIVLLLILLTVLYLLEVAGVLEAGGLNPHVVGRRAVAVVPQPPPQLLIRRPPLRLQILRGV